MAVCHASNMEMFMIEPWQYSMLEAWLPMVLTWIIKVMRQSADNVTIVQNGPQIRNQRHFYATGGPTSHRDTYRPTHPLCHTTWQRG